MTASIYQRCWYPRIDTIDDLEYGEAGEQLYQNGTEVMAVAKSNDHDDNPAGTGAQS